MYKQTKPQYLDALVRDHRLTPDGRDWLILALDPFHDLQHQAAGYPDTDGSQTVVSCYQYQMDLSAPAGVAGNWDAHIFNMPLSTVSNGLVFSEDTTWTTGTETAYPAVLGPLTIVTGAAGAVMVPINAPPATTMQATLGSPADLMDGVTRIIGMGFEVTNTTADMNKQGAVTCYRIPQYASEPGQFQITSAGTTQRAAINMQRWRQPPGTVAEANNIKGTRTWDAAQGVYATCVQNSVHNPMKMSSNAVMVFERAGAPTGGGSWGWMTERMWGTVNAPPLMSAFIGRLNQSVPFDTTGAMFTGLSNSTTLTIKFKVYVERAPVIGESQLSVLATPSAGYDVAALELYARAISQLPVAVTVAENGLGDWFRGVLRVIRGVSSVAIPAAMPFLPGAVGNAAQTIAGKMDNFINAANKSVSVIKNAIPGPKKTRRQKSTTKKPQKK